MDLGEFDALAYSITPKRAATINLAKLQQTALADCAVVFYDDVDKQRLAVVCADEPLDALLAWHDHARELLVRRDTACGIKAIEHMRARSMELRLSRAPAKPGPIVRELQRSISEGEGRHSDAEWRTELTSRRLFLWWDR